MTDFDDDYTPKVTGHETANGYAFTVEVRPPHPDDIADALARRIAIDYGARELKAAVQERFYHLVKEAVDDTAKDLIAAAMNAPRQRTDEFGNPVGDPITFNGLIANQVKSWQEETVDPQGRPKKPDSYNRDVITRFEFLVRQVGASEFEKLAKAEVAKVKQEAAARVNATIQKAVASAITALAAK